MRPVDIRSSLRRFCCSRVPELADEDDIFQSAGVTSLFVIELLAFVEERFDVVLEDEDLERDNFRSINALSALVERKLGLARSPAS